MNYRKYIRKLASDPIDWGQKNFDLNQQKFEYQKSNDAAQMKMRESELGFKRMAFGAGMALITGLSIAKMIMSLRNSVQHKNLIEDIYLNDPILKQLDKSQVFEWYATIMHFAPKFSLDKAAVRDVLHNFARFGKVDMQTLNMLAATEKNTSDVDKSSIVPWSSVFTSAVGTLG